MAQRSASVPHLDLRAPSHLFDSSDKAALSFSGAASHNASTQPGAQVSSMGLSLRTRGSIEEMAQHFRSEGLPVARLIETKSSLLHLGLNPKGKPGLWFIGKIH